MSKALNGNRTLILAIGGGKAPLLWLPCSVVESQQGRFLDRLLHRPFVSSHPPM